MFQTIKNKNKFIHEKEKFMIESFSVLRELIFELFQFTLNRQLKAYLT